MGQNKTLLSKGISVKSLKKLFVFGLIAGTSALTGCITSGSSNDASSESAARTAGSASGAGSLGVTKVTICHIPPGNPANAHSITVGSPAVRAHLAHGDSLGACPDVVPPVDTLPPSDSKPPKDEHPPKVDPPVDTIPPVVPPVDSVPPSGSMS